MASEEQESIHTPVMVSEVLEFLDPSPGQIIIDGTVGLGGHARRIASLLESSGTLIGFDRDAETLRCCKDNLKAFPNVSFEHGSYDTIPQVLANRGIPNVDGVLLDLGLSSFQLEHRERGFSFQKDGRLDMRFDTSIGKPASELIRKSDERTLRNWLFTYGEERRSAAIARQLKRATVMETVQDLKEAIRKSTPPAFRHKSFARVFQALRIAVNQELDHLDRFLTFFTDFLKPGGRIVVLAYHSLEDRRVKQRFRALSHEGMLQILTKKPLTATVQEIDSNPRSRSAKLRAAERMR